MACNECAKWEAQAKANLESMNHMSGLIKGLKAAIREMMQAMKVGPYVDTH